MYVILVRRIDVTRTPANLTTLPNEIFTPSESPACGLKIDAGKEYLLAGRVEGPNALFTVLCGQVLPDDRAAVAFENVLEWKNVPEALQTEIKAIKC
uniref:NTR domain-containing protein n=1 Tax=Caenorhabditis japonica TaxID=281687 RepID=A0A8R1IQV2_CAEJA